MDLQDLINNSVREVTALIACARVIVALQEAPEHVPEGGLITGNGFAGGIESYASDVTDILHVGIKILRQLDDEGSALLSAARKGSGAEKERS
ncbi:MAG: hypothetical protein AB7G13_22345 [Lautropia sp.]